MSKELETVEEVTATTEEFILPLKTPITVKGDEVDSLTFNLGGLTGRDSLAIEREIAMLGLPIYARMELSSDYVIRVAAKACTLPIGSDTIEGLGLAEFNLVRQAVRDFLTDTAS